MSGRLRRRSANPDHAAEEGPFVSFTDLFIGILFLFLILVAALMLMHQEAVQQEQVEAQAQGGRVEELKARLDAVAARNAEHPPFRLAIIYNVFQGVAARSDWIFARTVQGYRAPNGLCLNIVTLRNNFDFSWKPELSEEDIPTAQDQDYVRMGEPCTLSAAGESWASESETGGVNRVSANLYAGSSLLRKGNATRTLDLQYRILGIYDDHFR